MTPVLLLFSGGFDSMLTALLLKEQGFALHALSINFVGRPRQEICTARKLARRNPLFMNFVEFKLDWIDNAPQTKTGKTHPSEPAAGSIPYRNLVFWSVAVLVASRHGIRTVAGGHTNRDAAHYTDASPEFFQKLRALTAYSGGSALAPQMIFRLPLQEIPSDSYEVTVRQNLPLLQKTWSCWLNGKQPCRSCYACIERERYLRARDCLNHSE